MGNPGKQDLDTKIDELESENSRLQELNAELSKNCQDYLRTITEVKERFEK